MNHFPVMARFNRWVNAKLFETAAQLADDEYRRDRGAFFGSIHNTLNHLMVVDRLWTGRIEGVDRGIRSLDQILYSDFEPLRVARQEEDERLIQLVDRLDEDALQKPIVYRRMIGEGMEEVRTGHILVTLFNHQTHHRGQIHVMLTQCGITPPPLDVVFYLDEVGEAGPPGTISSQT